MVLRLLNVVAELAVFLMLYQLVGEIWNAWVTMGLQEGEKLPGVEIRKGRIFYVENPEDALKGANICSIFTEWKEVKAIQGKIYKQLM